jgi:hypothetical protein
MASLLALPTAGVHAETAPAGPPASVVIAAPKPEEVVNPLDCEKLLTMAGRDLNRADPAFAGQFEGSTNPFFPKPEAPPVQAPTTATTPAAPVVSRLSDSDKLAQVAAALQPSGTMGANGILILIFENRPPLRAGQVLRVTFPEDDRPTDILLLSVTQKAYTLKLNNTVLPVPFGHSTPSSPAPAKH